MRSFYLIARNMVILEMEYRIYYLVLIFSNLVTIPVEYSVLGSIFEGKNQIGSLPRSQVIPFIILGSVVRSGASLWTLVSDHVDRIREGSFQSFLMRPLHFPSYFFSQALGGKIFTNFLMFLTILVYKFGFSDGSFLNLQVLPQFLLAYSLGTILTWQIYLSMVYLGFWVEEASFMSTAFNISLGVFSGTLIPLDWIPSYIRKIIHLTPYPVIGDFPIRAGLGTLLPGEFSQLLVVSVTWVVGLALLNALLWNMGTKRYEAFGG